MSQASSSDPRAHHTRSGHLLESLRADETGAAFTETLIAFPVLLLFVLGLYQYTFVCAADLIVQRAASAAVRAAVVFLSDGSEWYEDPSPQARQTFIAEAARRVLLASAQFEPGSLRVEVQGNLGGFAPLTATVRTNFDCSVFIAGRFCGDDHKVELRASATLPYQGE